MAGPARRNLHSLPAYYGFYAALWAGLPALLVAALWVLLEGSVITRWWSRGLPAAMRELPPDRLGLLVNDITNLANGNIVSGEIDRGTCRRPPIT